MDSDIKILVDEYAKWDQLGKEAAVEIEKIKAQLQQRAVSELEDSKLKTVKYYGTNNNVAVITNAETVKMVSYSFLKAVLGTVTDDFVKENLSYKMTDPFKKMVAPICTGNYLEQRLGEVIRQMRVDDKTAKLLAKKLKGDPIKDAKILASLGVPDIDYWVYFVAEAVAYEKIVKLLEVAGYEAGTSEFDKALADIKQALICEESLKIGIEYEEAK